MKKILLLILLVLLGVIVFTFIFLWQLFVTIRPSLLESAKNMVEQNNQEQASSIDNIYSPETFNKSSLPLVVPNKFSFDIFAEKIGPVRDIVDSPDNGILASVSKEGKIIALPDKNQDGHADKVVTILSKLNNPHGLLLVCESFSDCFLYVAETNSVSRYNYDSEKYLATNRQVLFSLPGGGSHITRSLELAKVLGKEKIFVSVGSTCNVCDEKEKQRAGILMANLDGSDLQIFASGLRNSVFMDVNPSTGELWATDNGRDGLGNDLPPDEINIIKSGADYGWPLCYGQNIHDLEFDKSQYFSDPCLNKTAAYIDLPAHSAPLGIAFFPKTGWPEEFRHDALVAYHGSWNRKPPTGYKIVRVKLDEKGKFLGLENFLSGWLTKENKVLGRPVDVLIRPSGEIFISDDDKGAIYILKYQPDYIIEKVLTDADCQEDADCQVPGEYAVKSNLPYEAKCIENNCTVVYSEIFK